MCTKHGHNIKQSFCNNDNAEAVFLNTGLYSVLEHSFRKLSGRGILDQTCILSIIYVSMHFSSSICITFKISKLLNVVKYDMYSPFFT